MWQTIDSAPRDGEHILLNCPSPDCLDDFMCVGKYMVIDEDDWCGWVEIWDGSDLPTPTHWMPLPDPPA